MKIKVVLILFGIAIAVTVIFSSNVPSDIATTDSEGSLREFTTHIDQQIPKLMKKYSIPGAAIALIREGETIWTRYYGYADISQRQKMAGDTVMMAQSISKPVTAWGIMKLVQDGKIDLDIPIKAYLKSWKFPDSEFSEEKITVRNLLNLSAGVPLGDFTLQYDPRNRTPSLLEALAMEDTRLIQEPGSSFFYSNLSYAVLELLVEEVSGQRFAEFMQQEILTPLGMDNSSYSWSEDLRPKVATGYDLDGKPVPPYIYSHKASGGLFTTLDDLAHFVEAGMITTASSEVLNEESLRELYAPNVEIPGLYGAVSDAYGLGHFTEILSNGRRAVWHGGQGNGWMTHFHSIPETGDGIIILTNSQRSWPFFSRLLDDWSRWNGFSSVGMGIILQAQRGLKVVIGLIFLISLWQAWRIGSGLLYGKRHFAPFSSPTRLLTLSQYGLFVLILVGLAWSKSQDYLVITPIFPVLSSWLGCSLLNLGLVSLLSACFQLDRSTLSSGSSISNKTCSKLKPSRR